MGPFRVWVALSMVGTDGYSPGGRCGGLHSGTGGLYHRAELTGHDPVNHRGACDKHHLANNDDDHVDSNDDHP